MTAMDELRKAFDDCTVLAGIANTFECVYITKAAATAMLEEVEAENAKLRELVRHLYTCMERQEPDGSLLCANCPYENESNECDYELRMEELGVDA